MSPSHRSGGQRKTERADFCYDNVNAFLFPVELHLHVSTVGREPGGSGGTFGDY